MSGAGCVPAAPGQSVGASLALLIERLEKATEGSRPLDGAIHSSRFNGPELTAEDIQVNDEFVGHLDLVPPYSTSIDAALSLVPPDWAFQLLYEPGAHDGEQALCWQATIWPHKAAPLCKSRHPAIALCIAALKARATLQPHEAPPSQPALQEQNNPAPEGL